MIMLAHPPRPETPDLPACPHCGNPAPELWPIGGQQSVACQWIDGGDEEGCGMAGPFKETVEEAVAAWAELTKAVRAWRKAGAAMKGTHAK